MIVGIDVGGTFTDLVCFDGREFRVVKVPTTPKRPAEGVLNALKGFRIDEIDVIVHATTLGTNMFLGQEHLTPPRIALVTTKGFRDVIEIGRQRRPELYDLFFEKPKPLVRRRDRFEVEERVDSQGRILTPLNEKELIELTKKLKEYDVVVISFLNSYVNPVHEKRAKEIVSELCPNVDVIASHEIDPEYKEFERTSTTVVNAYLRPMMAKYLNELLSALKEMGFKGAFYVMQSSGGLASVESAMKMPAMFIESGPSAGAMAVAHYSKMTGDRKAIGFDMGGTTAKASTIVDHEPTITTEYEVGGKVHAGRIVKGSGYPVRFPFVDLAEVSAGGGTIAWVDEGGTLRVGPMSAGADPGPACYGKSDRPTVTDANLILGRLGERLGSGMKLRKDLALKAIGKLADELGMDVVDVAYGIIRIANTVMAKALRIVTVERGHDPRDFTMFCFGGAGPLHGVELGEELNVKSVVIPPNAGVFSAYGLLLTNFRVDRVKSWLKDAREEDIEEEFRRLERSAMEEVVGKEPRVIRSLDVRYRGQSYELNVPWMGLEESLKAFHEKHEALYGFRMDDEVEIVNLRVTVIGAFEKPKLKEEREERYEPKPEARRDVFFGDWIETPVYVKEKLKAGAFLRGPAVIESYDTTALIPPNYSAFIDRWGNVRVIEDDRV